MSTPSFFATLPKPVEAPIYGPDLPPEMRAEREAARPKRGPRKPVEKPFSDLPLQPLWEIARVRSDMPSNAAQTSASLGFTAALFADMVGHNVKAVTRWQEAGAIPWLSADTAAVALGMLPHEVWGDDWLNVKGDYEEIASGARDEELDRAWKHAAKKLASALEGSVAAEVLAHVTAVMVNDVAEAAPEAAPEPGVPDEMWAEMCARWDQEDREAEEWAMHVEARDEVFLNG